MLTDDDVLTDVFTGARSWPAAHGRGRRHRALAGAVVRRPWGHVKQREESGGEKRRRGVDWCRALGTMFGTRTNRVAVGAISAPCVALLVLLLLLLKVLVKGCSCRNAVVFEIAEERSKPDLLLVWIDDLLAPRLAASCTAIELVVATDCADDGILRLVCG